MVSLRGVLTRSWRRFRFANPTGTPWNDAVNQQALRSLARFDRLWARFFRTHPLVKDDKDVTEAELAKYHVVDLHRDHHLSHFGDPGSSRWIAKINGKLPVRWTKDTVSLWSQSFPAMDSLPAMIYPNPLNRAKYVVLNTGLTITDREYNGDYGTALGRLCHREGQRGIGRSGRGHRRPL
jgi:hypothetical protein